MSSIRMINGDKTKSQETHGRPLIAKCFVWDWLPINPSNEFLVLDNGRLAAVMLLVLNIYCDQAICNDSAVMNLVFLKKQS